MLTLDEYKDLGTDLQNISYSGDNLYFVVVKWEGDTISGYSYCKKDLNSNKITVYYNIDVDWAEITIESKVLKIEDGSILNRDKNSC